jgi:regulator of RNase E activity RraA
MIVRPRSGSARSRMQEETRMLNRASREQEAELLEICRAELYSAVVADTLDGFGLHDQSVTPSLTPLDDSHVLCGRVRIGVFMPVFHDSPELNVYEHEIELIDSLQPGDVPVVVCGTGSTIAPWGELLTTRARYLGAAGCITDGCVRDVRRIREYGFPVFCGGMHPTDTKHRGKMMAVDVPARLGGVKIESGDLVIGDVDGIVFVPRLIVDDVVAKALEKVRTENLFRDDLIRGDSLGQVFARYGIL